jgi:hypothetical protein
MGACNLLTPELLGVSNLEPSNSGCISRHLVFAVEKIRIIKRQNVIRGPAWLCENIAKTQKERK